MTTDDYQDQREDQDRCEDRGEVQGVEIGEGFGVGRGMINVTRQNNYGFPNALKMSHGNPTL